MEKLVGEGIGSANSVHNNTMLPLSFHLKRQNDNLTP